MCGMAAVFYSFIALFKLHSAKQEQGWSITVFKINKFGHRILALLKQQREKPENVMPERGFEP